MTKLIYTLLASAVVAGMASCSSGPKVISPVSVPNVDSLETYIDRASRTKDAKDQYFAANYYLQQYTASDTAKAIELLKLAAAQNYPFAANQLGNIFSADSTNSRYDINKAVEYYELGVKYGSDNAMTNLADLLMEGQGVEKDSERAQQLRAVAMLGILALAE